MTTQDTLNSCVSTAELLKISDRHTSTLARVGTVEKSIADTRAEAERMGAVLFSHTKLLTLLIEITDKHEERLDDHSEQIQSILKTLAQQTNVDLDSSSTNDDMDDWLADAHTQLEKSRRRAPPTPSDPIVFSPGGTNPSFKPRPLADKTNQLTPQRTRNRAAKVAAPSVAAAAAAEEAAAVVKEAAAVEEEAAVVEEEATSVPAVLPAVQAGGDGTMMLIKLVVGLTLLGLFSALLSRLPGLVMNVGNTQQLGTLELSLTAAGLNVHLSNMFAGIDPESVKIVCWTVVARTR